MTAPEQHPERHAARPGLARDLAAAAEELDAALRRAQDAAQKLAALAPRVEAITAGFAQLETLVETARGGFAGAEKPVHDDAPWYSRPTLVIPGAQPPASPRAPLPPIDDTTASSRIAASAFVPREEPEPSSVDAAPGLAQQALTSFRIEFESSIGPLDLRRVDEAVSDHPAVRDVALLDYDGRKATLKVWITRDATPAEIERALIDNASQLFADAAHHISIAALDEVA
jgi:hypothetical protein